MVNAWLEITSNTKSLEEGVKNEFRILYQYRIFYCGTFQFYENTSKIITL